MPSLYSKLSKSIDLLLEEVGNEDWKNPSSSDYSKEYAEDCLYHTVGPLTDSPRWSEDPWQPRASRMPPPEGYQAGGPAPRWTQHEVVIAYAGDPSELFKDTPTSPKGTPLMRLVGKISRGGKRTGKQEVSDLYQNGLTELSKLMKPGRDAGRSPFISWVTATIEGAVLHGVGITKPQKAGIKALKNLYEVSQNPTDAKITAVRDLIDRIGAKYRRQGDQQYDASPENPYAHLSPTIYTLGSELIAAFEAQDQEKISSLQAEIAEAYSEAKERGEHIAGATTGAFSAISTKDRATKLGMKSIDMPMGDEGYSPSETLMGSSGEDELGLTIDQDATAEILKLGLSIDLVDVYGSSSDFDDFLQKANASIDEVRGTFSVDEFRVIIRNLGGFAKNYPGKNVLRKSGITRGQEGWWRPNEDPEIEVGPEGQKWASKWRMGGMIQMSNEDISAELMNEPSDLKSKGIPFSGGASEAATISAGGKATLSRRDIEMYQKYLQGAKGAELAREYEISKQLVSKKLSKVKEAIEKGAVSLGDVGASLSPERVNALSSSAQKKMMIISIIYSDDIRGEEVNESLNPSARAILESYDAFDRQIISETAAKLSYFLERKMVLEYCSPRKQYQYQEEPSLAALYNKTKMRSFTR